MCQEKCGDVTKKDEPPKQLISLPKMLELVHHEMARLSPIRGDHHIILGDMPTKN
jgi:hypothetical protein